MINKLKTFLPILIVILFGIISGSALIHKGLPPTHDGEYHVVRFFLFDEAIRDGNLYPRWAAHLNNNFGVPLFTFVYPLPNYIATFFHLFGISFIDSFKLELFLATVLGGIFFYLWAKEFWGKLGGIVSSAFYTFSPYHIVDVYIRGSVGEVWALAFFPAFLWAYTLFVKSKRMFYAILSSIFFSLIIFSHNILALMFAEFAVSYVLLLIILNKDKMRQAFESLFIILLGIGLSAIFWLPALYETKFATGLQIFDVTAHFPDLYQLLIPTWGSSFSGAGINNELSYQIGIANLFAVFLNIFVILFQLKRKDKKVHFTFFFLAWFALGMFLMLDMSAIVWKTFPLMNYFQFPWRLLSIEILFASFLAGSIFSLIKNINIKLTVAIILVFLSFILSVGYAKSAYYLEREDKYYITRSNFMDGTNSPGNVFNTIFLKTIPDKKKDRAEILDREASISVVSSKSSEYVLRVNANKNSKVMMNLPYYPGWNVYINNEKKEIKATKDGRFTFPVGSGESLAQVKFEDTAVRQISAFISFLSIIILSTLFIKYKSSKI